MRVLFLLMAMAVCVDSETSQPLVLDAILFYGM